MICQYTYYGTTKAEEFDQTTNNKFQIHCDVMIIMIDFNVGHQSNSII